MPETRLFISYAADDKAFATHLRELLEQKGADVFDFDGSMPDGNWQLALREQLLKSSALIMIVPPFKDSGRNLVWFEAGAARALGKRIVAVMPPKSKTKRDIPTNLADLVVLDTHSRSLESLAATILQAA